MSAACPHCGLVAPSSTAVGLTAKQRRVMQYLEHCAGESRVPSYDEIAHAVGFKARSGVCNIVKLLEDRGHIRRFPHAHRSIVVIGMQPEARV